MSSIWIIVVATTRTCSASMRRRITARIEASFTKRLKIFVSSISVVILRSLRRRSRAPLNSATMAVGLLPFGLPVFVGQIGGEGCARTVHK